ncbi:short-chain dehydrogenase/reductase SDR (plasmid) [Emticicia oligotrophica DSM 17448]|uniref:Short-chain dehydrogenase/reductase SDR n=1 Tax=Emticicia oligotrophica (strain DSM 17448 / CIP 109782 / MTCC 6937 / GPTSA100-15) TaxID=929562 RepID=A0ABN4AWE6_EMTOG|nr:SDR family oxidoreductase [Emticicia oligotrophica]AFK05613.1 short-chain dehydrogenase/reductase SDR [Emticicia oligotrophica DSM 17448]
MKTVLVTGGAGEIGSAICKKFAENGFSVLATYNTNSTKAENLLEELNAIRNPQSEIPNHYIFHAPTTDAQKVNDLKAFVEGKYGKLDVLVNNAGITTPIPHNDLEGMTDEWIDKIMQTNFRGGFAMVRAMRDLLDSASDESKDSSLIVNISSIAGIYGIGSNVAYCASKSAIDSMTRSLARALAPKIRVVSVSPGFVEGEYTRNFDPSYLQNQMDNTPLGRFATGVDVANVVFSLATTMTFSTGNIITVDGGRLLK